MKMPPGVPMRRVIATTNMPARPAYPKMHPGRVQLQALLASARSRRDSGDGASVRAVPFHRCAFHLVPVAHTLSDFGPLTNGLSRTKNRSIRSASREIPILMLCPISPASRSSCRSHSSPFRQRSTPSSDRSIRNAMASLPGPRARSSKAFGAAIEPHDRDAFEWLKRPDQHADADPLNVARNIQHVGNAVGQINISVPTLQKQRAVARRHPPIAVPSGVADNIRLGLDNPPADDAFRQLPHHHLADEITGQRLRIDRQLGTRDRRMATLTAATVSLHQLDQMRARKAQARTDRQNTASRAPPSPRQTP